MALEAGIATVPLAHAHGGVPGTIRLVDDVVHGGSGAVVLQPRPSADPEDPLNWSRGRKHLAIGMVYLYTFGIGIATAVQYSVLTQIAEAQDLTIGELNLGTGLMFLFLGWACLIWQPIAMRYGRRGVYIVSIVLSIAPMIWAPYSHGAGQWYAHRILLGIFAAPVESLPEVTVPDLFFAHERGTYMAVYAFVLFGSNFLAPFFAGFINDGTNWHWVMYFGALVLAACAIIMFFFMEDTIYFRVTSEEDSDIDLEQTTEKDGKGPTSQTLGTGQSFPTPRSYLQKLSLITVVPGRPSGLQTLKKSWRALTIFCFFPNIVWAGLLYGTNLAWYNVLNGTMSSILGSEPYDFAPTMVGVAYLSPLIAGAVTCLWCGWAADAFALRLARRNGGIREPEHRLWTLAATGVVSAAGLILWGVGASREIHFMGPIIGLAFVTFGVVGAGSIALAYTVDCFKELTGETMITVIIIRNTLGFAFNYAITPWINNLGLQNCFISVSMICLFSTATFLVMIVFGKKLRKLSAKKYWQYVEENRAITGSH